MTTKLIIIILFSLTTFVKAASIAKVIKVKGEVTILPPHAKKVHSLKLGEKLVEDSSILTKNKSLAIVLFNDKSRMIVGPNSKIIIQKQSKQKQQLISLLKGKLRANIEKKKDKKIKFIVKSRTASLGVRGTSFQTSFNPKNNVTSLITFTGQVAMVKRKKESTLNSERKKGLDQANEIIKDLESKKAVLVKKGRYSGVSENLTNATVPVKIAPEQYARLKLNDTFGVDKTASEKEIKNEIVKIEKEFSKDKTSEKKEDTQFDEKTNFYRPRSGGLVDIESGIYVPPSEDSVFDNKIKIFKATEKIGAIKKSGDYVAPKGVTLDAKEGFIISGLLGKEEKEKIAKHLNKIISGQYVKPKKLAPQKPSLDNLENKDDVYDKYFKIE